MKELNLVLKRITDVILSAIFLLLLSPLLLICILLIKTTMPGPVFFFQERVGKNGKLFKIYKLRTMKVNHEAESTFNTNLDAERITPLGAFMRRFKIDEVVQLINVLKGEMSLVGPRPTLKNQVDKYTDFERQRLKMSPGMTGLAQVNGNVALEWSERIIYDVEYVSNYTYLLDVKILFKTVLIVLFGEGKYKKIPAEIPDKEKEKIEK